MTVTEVKGYGRQKGHKEIYRGAEYAVNFLPKLRVDVAVPTKQVRRSSPQSAMLPKPVRSVTAKIFVMGLDHAVRIRTGETDNDAL